jgi:hypothetical protein
VLEVEDGVEVVVHDLDGHVLADLIAMRAFYAPVQMQVRLASGDPQGLRRTASHAMRTAYADVRHYM